MLSKEILLYGNSLPHGLVTFPGSLSINLLSIHNLGVCCGFSYRSLSNFTSSTASVAYMCIVKGIFEYIPQTVEVKLVKPVLKEYKWQSTSQMAVLDINWKI